MKLIVNNKCQIQSSKIKLLLVRNYRIKHNQISLQLILLILKFYLIQECHKILVRQIAILIICNRQFVVEKFKIKCQLI